MESCSTCATILPSERPCPSEDKDKDKDKTQPQDRRVKCCARVICGKCIQGNQRFASYCPYCQISSAPSALPQRLKDPPSYTSVPSTSSKTTELSRAPPPYSPAAVTSDKKPEPVDEEKAALADEEKDVADDILHFLDHEHDNIASLSLRYGVPADALRRANNIASDHLLLGRRTVLIPGEYYKGGVSLSPRPIEGEEEELRKAKIRRFMTASKVSDYDVALLYLEQSSYDLADAVEAYFDDEAWERDHPMAKRSKDDSTGAKRRKERGPFWRGL